MLHGSQRAAGPIALVVFWGMATTTMVAGSTVRSSANFTVLAPNTRLADTVVDRAEMFRSRIGAVWLGTPPPATRTPTTIYVEVDPDRSFARTLIDPVGERHMVWLVGSETAVTKYLLAHEIAHVVLAEKFGDAMPVWANEGIASRYDNDRRKAIRDEELRGFVRIEIWPHLDELFKRPVRQPWQYAAAVSVTDFLVDRGGRERFLHFVADSRGAGWNKALRKHYRIASIAELQDQWQQSVRNSLRKLSTPNLVATAEAASSTRFVQ